MGEKLDDFEVFHPERMASRILGMGDVLTLIEKASTTVNEEDAKKLAKKMNEEDAKKLAKKMKENTFDMNDLLEQMQALQKLGPLKQIMGMLPGVGNQLKDADLDAGESQLKKTECIIYSMTKKEREKPSIINPPRKRRIAAGSGTSVEDVNKLLKQFEQMQKMMKQFGGAKGKKKRFGGLPGLGGGFPGGFPGM